MDNLFVFEFSNFLKLKVYSTSYEDSIEQIALHFGEKFVRDNIYNNHDLIVNYYG